MAREWLLVDVPNVGTSAFIDAVGRDALRVGRGLPADADPSRTVTVVRDPVPRVLSHYEHTCVNDAPVPIEEFIRRPEIVDCQSRALGGVDPAELALVGTSGELDRFTRAFAELSGLPAELARVPREDRDRRRRQEVPASLAREIRELNPGDDELHAAVRGLQAPTRPRISVVVPIYESDPGYLQAAIDSVKQQTFGDWELILVDDGSRSRPLKRVLGRAGRDPRIRLHRRPGNGGFSAATNDGLALAQGDFIALVDHDDLLAPGALEAVDRAFRDEPRAEILYTDQNTIGPDGAERYAFPKPGPSPIYALGVMYIGHLLVARRGLVERVGGCDERFDGAQDFEWFLRLSERAREIIHVPEALYSWRAIDGSLAADPDAKPAAARAQLEAVRSHLDRTGVSGVEVEQHPRFPHRLQLAPGERRGRPSVSIIIPTYEQGEQLRRCVDSIERLTSYPDLEIVAVDGGSTEPGATAVLERESVTVVADHDRPFNFSRACNAGATAAAGEVLIFLNNDTEVIDRDWIELLLTHLELPGVGAVGPLLTYPDTTVQHAGVVVGLRGTADHLMRGFDCESEGLAGSLCCAREVSAVTGAALCIRRATFERLDGFDTIYATHYQDVDLCLRLRALGQSILYAPRPRLIHHEGTSRGSGYDFVDRALLIEGHSDVADAIDPFYNPRFTRDGGSYELAVSVEGASG